MTPATASSKTATKGSRTKIIQRCFTIRPAMCRASAEMSVCGSKGCSSGSFRRVGGRPVSRFSRVAPRSAISCTQRPFSKHRGSFAPFLKFLPRCLPYSVFDGLRWLLRYAILAVLSHTRHIPLLLRPSPVMSIRPHRGCTPRFPMLPIWLRLPPPEIGSNGSESWAQNRAACRYAAQS